MPPLEFCNRKWRIGSDEFIVPFGFEAAFRYIWLIVISFSWGYEASSLDCEEGEELQILMGTEICILIINIIINFFLVKYSMKGAIMDTHLRKNVPIMLSIRILLGVPEIIWTIVATVLLSTDLLTCTEDNVLVSYYVLTGLVGFNWLRLLFLSFILMLASIPSGKRSARESNNWCCCVNLRNPQGEPSQQELKSLWAGYCKTAWKCLMCCCYCRNPWSSSTEDPSEEKALNEVAGLMAAFFHDLALVPSDIAAGLLLLSKSSSIVNADSNGEDFDSPTSIRAPMPWMTYKNAHYFAIYALESYNTEPKLSNNCEIIYISRHNSVYKLPFFVAIDRNESVIVVAIRGTLSGHDALTDLTAATDFISVCGQPTGCHRGMLQSANFLFQQLESTNILKRAVSDNPGYGIVITGHSLGAGSGALLSLLLLQQADAYPEIRCFAFSPPGGLLSLTAANHTEDFCLSVIIGDDLVPRLSLSALEELMHRVERALDDCAIPKYRIFRIGCQRMFFSDVTETKNPYYAVVSHIVSPAQFWVQRKSNQKLLTLIKEQLSNVNSQVTEIIFGEMYAIKHPKFDFMARAIAKSKFSESAFEVHFIDYGNNHLVSIEEIHRLPIDLLKIKPMALKCSMESSDENLQYSDEDIEHFKKFMSQRITHVVLGEFKDSIQYIKSVTSRNAGIFTNLTDGLNEPKDLTSHDINLSTVEANRNEEPTIYFESLSDQNEVVSERLYLPGRILQVNLNKSFKHSCFWKQREDYDQIVVTNRMLLDHRCDGVVEALYKLSNI